jgi:hypothetical protein
MRLRLLTVLLITGLPLIAHADSTGIMPSDNSAAGLTAPANAGSLGPATNTGNASSSADSGTLQPAGTSPLQSTTNDSTGLTAPTGGNSLQAPTGNQQLQVIMGDGDGPTHNVANTSSSPWTVLWWSLGVALLLATVWILHRRRLLRRRARARHMPNLDDLPSHEAHYSPASAEPTSSQRLRINIHKPATEVFAFVLDPKNTPKWISFITSETTNEWPAKLGTIYTNTDESGEVCEFELTQFKPDEMFVLSKKSNTYHVRYTLTLLNDEECELEYYEWMDEGNLAQPFTSQQLKHLKSAIEHPAHDPASEHFPEQTPSTST